MFRANSEPSRGAAADVLVARSGAPPPLWPARSSSSLSFYYFASHWHKSQNIVIAVLPLVLQGGGWLFVGRQLTESLAENWIFIENSIASVPSLYNRHASGACDVSATNRQSLTHFVWHRGETFQLQTSKKFDGSAASRCWSNSLSIWICVRIIILQSFRVDGLLSPPDNFATITRETFCFARLLTFCFQICAKFSFNFNC